MLFRSLFFVVCCIVSQSLFGWSDRGHKLITATAWHNMTRAQQRTVTNLLQYHPAYQSVRKHRYNGWNEDVELGMFLMMQASVWIDEIRDKEAPDYRFNKPEWHYITCKTDYENGHTADMPDKPNVVWAIDFTCKKVNDVTLANDIRAAYLAWLIHLVCDVHQPLHCGSLFNETYPEGDQGGEFNLCAHQ